MNIALRCIYANQFPKVVALIINIVACMSLHLCVWVLFETSESTWWQGQITIHCDACDGVRALREGRCSLW